MKYLCMVIIDEKKLQAMSESEAQALDDESLEYDDVLRKRGHFLAAQALAICQLRYHCTDSERESLNYRWTLRRDARTNRWLYPD